MYELEQRDGIAELRLCHGKANALDIELSRALASVLETLIAERPRAVVVTGSGNIFSAGVDLFRTLEGGKPYVAEFLPALESLFMAFLRFPLPVVAAVNGHAIAGGCVLACACDQRVMAEGEGKIGVPELHVGVPFPTLALELLRACVEPARLREIAFTGRSLSPADALEAGLVEAVVPAGELLARAHERAARLAAIPPRTFALAKRQLAAPALAHHERNAPRDESEIRAIWQDEETLDNIRRYLDRTLRKKD